MTAANLPAGAARSSLERVHAALDAADRRPKQTRDHLQASCPLHDDRKPSLSVDWKSERGGITRLHCHSCRASERDLLEAIGLTLPDRFDQPLEPKRSPPRGTVAPQGNRLGPLPKRIVTDPTPAAPEPEVLVARHLTRTYDYVDEDGDLLYQVLRYEWETSAGRDKNFEQRRPDGHGGWIPRTGDRKVLRHLPAVREAIAHGRQIWLTEGEKDDESLNRALPRDQGVATSHAGGASNFGDLAEQLRDAHVVLVVDLDPAGYRRAGEVTRKLRGVAASVTTVLPALAEPHADATDHVDAGHGIDEFIALTEEQITALVAEAEAQEAAKQAEEQVHRVQVCLQEARAQLEASRQAARRGAPATARDAKRYAVRWAHEAAKAATRVADAAERVWQRQQQVQQVPLPVPRAPQALLGRAEQAQRTAQRLAGQAWDEVGEPRPAPIQQSLTAPTPSERHPNPAPAASAALPAPTPLPARPDTGERPDGPPGEVLPFPGGRGGGGSGGGAQVEAIRASYERIDGHGLYEIKTDRGGNPVRHEVLSLDVRITDIEVLEAGPDATTRDGIPFVVPQSVASYVITYTHPLTQERLTQRIEGDRAGTCEWLGDLGVLVEYDSSSKGRARVWDAIRSTSKGARMVTIHESTGWRELPGTGWTYLHAGGGICADGAVDAMVRLPGAIDRIELPDPVGDPQLLRDMFDRDSRALMSRLPAHAGVVLAGTAYRAVLGTTKSSTCLFGTPATYKSALAALTMHHFGVRWERSGASTSMSGHGATVNALPELWWHAKDALFFGDDFAPDKSVEAAGSFLSTVARMQYNQEIRSRVNMRLRGGRGGVQQGYVTRTTLMLTSEVKATADSGNQRLAVVDLAKGEVNLAQIIALDQPESRMGRATVMSSLLAWIARDQPAHVARGQQRARLAAERRRGEGLSDRVAEPLGELEAGWELVGDWLLDIGAYTALERAAMIAEVQAALTEAGHRSLDPDSPTSVGERVRRLLGTCLRSGTAHVTAVGGYPPGEPEALRLGWRRVVGLDARVEPRGDHIGAITRSVHGSRLHLDPEGTMAVILAVARKSGEPLPVTKTVVQRELAAVGILRTEHDGRSVRYTVPVPDPAGVGGQVRRWDLDADRIFQEPEPPPMPAPAPAPTQPGPVGPDSYPPEREEPDDVDQPMVDPPESGPLAAADEVAVNRDQIELFRERDQIGVTVQDDDDGPCEVCGDTCCLLIAGHRVHYACALSAGFQVTDDPADPTRQEAEPVPPTSPAAAAPRPPNQQRPGATPRPAPRTHPTNRSGSGWKRSVAVIDASGIYLPDGPSSDGVELDGIDTIGMIGESLDVGHVAAPGLLVLTQSALDKLGVMPDGQVLTAPNADGQPATEDVVATRILDHLGAQLQVLVSRDGWTVDGGRLMPWTVIRRGDRALRLVLEPFVWIWDRRSDSPSPFTDLPDPDEDPAACWVELARRLDRIAQLLGAPWSTSAGITGAALFDRIQRRRDRRGGRVLDTAGVVPALTATGQQQLEGEINWPAAPHDPGDRPIRPIAEAELDAAAAVHWYDRRGSYLAPAGGADLPMGDPREMDAAEAAAVIAEHRWGKLPAGLWEITLPAWDEQQLPPPHPDQRRYGPVTRWVTSPTLRLLLDDQDAGGVGYTPEDLQIGPAWIWPESGRLLEPWYRQLREALLAARQQEPDGGPISRAIKGVFTGYIGRMDSEFAARSARPWHHQPVWRAIIIAAARSGLWRVLRRHQLATGRTPVQVHIDEVAYLSANTDAAVNPPAEDTGALGKLKVSGSRVLTDQARAALLKDGRVNDERTWSVDEPAPRTP